MNGKIITNQGKLTTAGNILFDAVKGQATVNKIVFNNPTNIPYTVTLYKYNKDSGLDVFPLYTYNLNAGDIVNDTNKYLLDIGDYLQASSNSNKTLYIIEAQYDSSI